MKKERSVPREEVEDRKEKFYFPLSSLPVVNFKFFNFKYYKEKTQLNIIAHYYNFISISI